MNQRQNLPIRWLALGLMVVALLASGLAAFGQDDGDLAPDKDGRINAAAVLGGIAIYCVDENGSVAGDWDHGGVRVLDITGNQLLWVHSPRIAEVGVPVVNTRLEEDNGVTLYRLTDGSMQLDGVDEHGSAFQFVFPGCQPVGISIQGSEEDDAAPEATEVTGL